MSTETETTPTEHVSVSKGQVYFYGASDDLIEVEGKAPGCDEYPGDDARFLVICTGEQRCYVRVRYNADGCWEVSAAPVDDETAMPSVMTISQHETHRYSGQIGIWCVLQVVKIAVPE